jgi:hypothetical protein
MVAQPMPILFDVPLDEIAKSHLAALVGKAREEPGPSCSAWSRRRIRAKTKIGSPRSAARRGTPCEGWTAVDHYPGHATDERRQGDGQHPNRRLQGGGIELGGITVNGATAKDR